MTNIIRTFIILGITLFLIFSCTSEKYSLDVELSGARVVKGVFERSLFERDSAFSWYSTNYALYNADSSIVNEIASLSRDVHFVLVLGTWCGDSKREVPHLFKIFDRSNISDDQILMVGVDREKKSPNGSTEPYNIQRVPTLIVFKGDGELGRIVEYPRETLERDILRILKKQ